MPRRFLVTCPVSGTGVINACNHATIQCANISNNYMPNHASPITITILTNANSLVCLTVHVLQALTSPLHVEAGREAAQLVFETVSVSTLRFWCVQICFPITCLLYSVMICVRNHALWPNLCAGIWNAHHQRHGRVQRTGTSYHANSSIHASRDAKRCNTHKLNAVCLTTP